jgi:hypothetical protein
METPELDLVLATKCKHPSLSSLKLFAWLQYYCMPLDDCRMIETCCGNNIRIGEEGLLRWRTINCLWTHNRKHTTVTIILDYHGNHNSWLHIQLRIFILLCLDGSQRPYSRLSRPEPLLFLSSSFSVALTRLSDIRYEFLKAKDILYQPFLSTLIYLMTTL